MLTPVRVEEIDSIIEVAPATSEQIAEALGPFMIDQFQQRDMITLQASGDRIIIRTRERCSAYSHDHLVARLRRYFTPNWDGLPAEWAS